MKVTRVTLLSTPQYMLSLHARFIPLSADNLSPIFLSPDSLSTTCGKFLGIDAPRKGHGFVYELVQFLLTPVVA